MYLSKRLGKQRALTHEELARHYKQHDVLAGFAGMGVVWIRRRRRGDAG